MKSRAYGRHGITVTALGLGGHREGAEYNGGTACTARFFLKAEERAGVVIRALERGVTYFETTYGCEIASLGESLRIAGADREKIFISGMRVDFIKNIKNEKRDPRAYVREEVMARLAEAGIDRLDQFLLGAVDMGDPLGSPALVKAALGELDKLKEEGLIRYAGFSCHDPDYAARLLDAYPVFDAVMVPYNCANRTLEGALTTVARKTRTPLIAMKPLVWSIYGVPVTALCHIAPVGGLKHDPEVDIAALAIRFVLANPAVAVTVPAVNAVADMDANAAAAEAGPLSMAEQAQAEAFTAAMRAEGSVPLAIAGLCINNFRARVCAIGHIEQSLKLAPAPIDRSHASAEAAARARARALVHLLGRDPRWQPFVKALTARP
ncbi:MAG: aldo/keto reductase [Planctomycetota bacterium]